MTEVGLVSCVKTKKDEPATPKDLYTSTYFKKMRSYAEQHHDDWWILSAKHGLLDPNGAPIDSYNETLTTVSKTKQREWSKRVVEQINTEGLLINDVTLVLHAGRAYYEELLPHLEEAPVTIEIPTEGLAIGERMAWYNDRI